jgi:SAM-dependent methyltransferase
MNCDQLAPYYQPLEYAFFGRSLEHRRFSFLLEMAGSRRALVCGGGDGRFLARLLRFNPHIAVDFVDASPVMTSLAERRIAGMGHRSLCRVHFNVCDIREFDPGETRYDLIVTHFFLDCFSDEEIHFLISRLLRWMLPGGQWIVSEFREADGLFGRLWTGAVIRSLYAAFRISTGLRVARLPNYYQPLLAQNLHPRRQELALGGLLCSSLWQTDSAFEGILQ